MAGVRPPVQRVTSHNSTGSSDLLHLDEADRAAVLVERPSDWLDRAFRPEIDLILGNAFPPVGQVGALDRERRFEETPLGEPLVPADILGQFLHAVDVRPQRFAHGPTRPSDHPMTTLIG